MGSIHSASGTVDLAKRGLWQSMLLYRGLFIMLLPAIAWFLIFEYYPMYGVIIAFKKYRICRASWAARGWAWTTSSACSAARSS